MSPAPQARRLRDAVDRVAKRSPARFVLGVFAAIILVVTALLRVPAATLGPGRAPFVDALFTAVSAVCVTGLTTVSTAAYWSPFGQAVILVGVKVGGLGVMTLASVLALAVSRRIGLTHRLLVASETQETRLGEVGTLIRAVLITSLTVEILLIVVLLPRFVGLGYSAGESLWQATFMSLSIFNNAGFVILDGGLAPHVGDWAMVLPIIVGGAIGALGFPVLLNVADRWRRPRTWSLHAKLTLSTYGLLTVGGALVLGALEWTNSATLGGLGVSEKVLSSLLFGVNSRSSGLSTIDVAELREASWLRSEEHTS